MDCQFTEKLSLLIDGELPDDEVGEVQAHLAGCPLCRQAREDFLLLRAEIQGYDATPDARAQRQALQSIVGVERPPFWRRKIALPAPALALLALLFVVVTLWAVLRRPPQTVRQPSDTLSVKRPVEPAVNPFDLSRFDRGGRAVIYTTRRGAADDPSQKEGGQ
jgi:anti-sigma factor RsiW